MDIDQAVTAAMATIGAMASNQALFLISLVISLVSLWIVVRTLGYMTIFALGLVVGVLCSRTLLVALDAINDKSNTIDVASLFETIKHH